MNCSITAYMVYFVRCVALLFKSNERSEYSYKGLADFFSGKSQNFTLSFDFSRFDF